MSLQKPDFEQFVRSIKTRAIILPHICDPCFYQMATPPLPSIRHIRLPPLDAILIDQTDISLPDPLVPQALILVSKRRCYHVQFDRCHT